MQLLRKFVIDWQELDLKKEEKNLARIAEEKTVSKEIARIMI